MIGAGGFAATCGVAADVAAEDPGAGAAFGVLGVAEGGAVGVDAASTVAGAVAKAQLLSDAGAHVEAVGLIDAALARHPDHPHLRYQRAMAM